jgi:DNA-binding GntR family transcriptional regulator
MTTTSRVPPLYYQVRDLLLKRISKGEWPEDGRIPTELDLAKEYCVSLSTMQRALEELVARDFLVRINGEGIFVKRQNAD